MLDVSGGDFVDGGKGMDSVAISAAFDDVYITETGDVRTIATANGIITVRNVELIRFSDGVTFSRFVYGEPSTLTAGTDKFDGSSARDSFRAQYYGSDEGGVTINDKDQLDGRAGSDVLQIVVLADGSIAPHLESIETINVAIHEASFAIDLVNTVGVRTLAFGRTDGTFIAENVSSIVEMQLKGTVSGTLAVEYSADVVSGDSDTQHVTINGAAGAISVTDVEFVDVVSIASDGQSNRLTLDAANLHTLTVAGDATIAIDGLGINTKVVDASLAIGGIELTFDHASGILATGGEGDDVFDFSAVIESDGAGGADFAGAVVDGGDGDDIFEFASNFDGATAIKDGEYWAITTDGTAIKFTNVELLKFADGTVLVSDLDNADPVGEILL